MMEGKEEIKVRISSNIVIKLRIMKHLKGKTFSTVVEEALEKYFEGT